MILLGRKCRQPDCYKNKFKAGPLDGGINTMRDRWFNVYEEKK